jgi:hypothetical protein
VPGGPQAGVAAADDDDVGLHAAGSGGAGSATPPPRPATSSAPVPHGPSVTRDARMGAAPTRASPLRPR